VALVRRKPIGDRDLRQAALYTLDAIANAVGGRNSLPGKLLCQWGKEHHGDAARQAFVMAGLTHILETDDLHRASVTHPGCVVVPAVLALGARQKVGGRALLTAVLHGFEAMCRIGNSVGRAHYKIWHNTATCGPFGSAMAAATLLQLTDEECVHALGNAGTQSSGLWEFLDSGAMSKHLHAGRAAESGITATELAALGFTGPPAILEGDKGFFAAACPDAVPSAVCADADADWQLRQTSIKLWPSCRHTHPAIDAALTDGRVEFNSFSGESRARLSVLRRKITVRSAEPYKSAYPNKYWGAAVSVTTAGGDTLTEKREACKGDPEAALSDAEMFRKAEMLLGHGGMDSAQSRALIEAVMGLADDEVDWGLLESVFPGEIRS
jgi:2-methylcitrate dehydratase PrpD